jgi:catechol 2,3-dioxygenase-like lactoylglutathione lyase family enzyme
MIDHVVLNVRDVARSKRFYAAALAPLGYKVIKDSPEFTGLGTGASADMWLSRRDPATAALHLAFACATRSMVDAFHAAALEGGGRDNGAPGLRPQYHPDYYGAFALDPDGNNVEAVCHEPVVAPKKGARTTGKK